MSKSPFSKAYVGRYGGHFDHAMFMRDVKSNLENYQKSQKWLAGVLKVSPSLVSRWMKGGGTASVQDITYISWLFNLNIMNYVLVTFDDKREKEEIFNG